MWSLIMILRRFFVKLMTVGLLAGVVLVAACAPKVAEKKTRYFWPVAPEKPRFEFLQEVYTELDLRKENFLDKILGVPDVEFMFRPFGIAANNAGTIVYVSEPGVSQLMIFDSVRQSARHVDLEVRMDMPFGLWVDSQDNLYVVDGGLKKVMVFSPELKFLREYGGKGVLTNPTHVAVDERLGRVYVSDSKTHRIDVFDLAGSQYLLAIGDKGEPTQRLYVPQGMAIAKDGTVYVCDMLNSRIVSFSPDGTFKSSFGSLGDSVYNFEFPKDLAIDSDGNLHIVDVRKAALLSYSADGKMLLHTGSGRKTAHSMAFQMPSGIWIDGQDRVYIVDHLARRYTVWQYFNDRYLADHPELGGEVKDLRPPVK